VAEAVLLGVAAADGATAEIVADATGREGPPQAAASIAVASATAIASVARISLDRRPADTTVAS